MLCFWDLETDFLPIFGGWIMNENQKMSESEIRGIIEISFSDHSMSYHGSDNIFNNCFFILGLVVQFGVDLN